MLKEAVMPNRLRTVGNNPARQPGHPPARRLMINAIVLVPVQILILWSSFIRLIASMRLREIRRAETRCKVMKGMINDDLCAKAGSVSPKWLSASWRKM